MADLVVLGFDTRRDAEEVFEFGASLEGDELLDWTVAHPPVIAG